MKVLGLIGIKGAGKDTMAEYLISDFAFERVGFADELYKQVAQAYGTTVAILNRRETKETPLSMLALADCRDHQFVEIALQTLGHGVRFIDCCLTFLQTGVVLEGADVHALQAVLQASRQPRWTLQVWGTEYRRKSRFGVDAYWLNIVADVIASRSEQSFVITDVRFVNEVKFVESIGGQLMRIRRPALELREAADRANNGTAAHSSEVELLEYPVPYEVVNIEGEPNSLMRAFDLLGLCPAVEAA